jgi:death-on-curing protein
MFLSLNQVHRLHAMGLEDHGGSPGIRDEGLIESALASAQNTYLYGGGDAFDVAASYAFHLAEAQAYLDGNKRVGIMAALTFLAMQGHRRDPSIEIQDQLYDAMIAIAKHELDKPGLASLLRRIFQSGAS